MKNKLPNIINAKYNMFAVIFTVLKMWSRHNFSMKSLKTPKEGHSEWPTLRECRHSFPKKKILADDLSWCYCPKPHSARSRYDLWLYRHQHFKNTSTHSSTQILERKVHELEVNTQTWGWVLTWGNLVTAEPGSI